MAIDFTGTAPITGGGQVFVRNSNGEWEKANVTAPGIVRTFYTTGTAATHTWAPGAISAKVIVTGGGGGGGGVQGADAANTAGGGGGQAGGTAIKWYTAAEMGATATYTVGSGGTGAAATGGDGSAGGDTTFNPSGTGATITGSGGDFGEGSGAVTSNVQGYLGGADAGGATSGDINIPGGDGHTGFGGDFVTNGFGRGGHGGSSYWGGGGLPGETEVTGSNGYDGQAYGSGGGGGAMVDSNGSNGGGGGDGVGGCILIEEYIRQSVLSPVAYDNAGNALLDLSTNDVVAPGSDNGDDLGSSSKRWNDLFIGGNIYIGGTGAANALDDYEEGTWTPTFTTSGTDFTSLVYDGQVGSYIKVGNQCTVCCYLDVGAGSTLGSPTGGLRVAGLPFAAENVADTYYNGCGDCYSFTGAQEPNVMQTLPNSSLCTLLLCPSGANATSCVAADLATNSSIYMSLTYRTV